MGLPVTSEQDREIHIGPPPLLEPPRNSSFFKVFGLIVTLVVIGGVADYFWLNYERQTGVSSTANAGVPAAEQSDETVSLKDFQAFQQQTTDSLQSATQDIAAQQAELKQLSDQIAALTTKIDALQGGAAPVPNRLIAPARPAAVAPPKSAIASPGKPATAAVASKKPSTPRPAGPISIGGAPLPPAPAQDDQ